ncbi:MAG: hypothetical protein LAP87_16590 [Acidobacteriia bacterium]|nr:hypothetical protein [Terriglobia bacterium]
MNDLTTYQSVRAGMRGGDILFFDGSDASDLVHIIGDFTSNAIKLLTRGPTHSAMVYSDSSLLIESTILNGKSGPQWNPLEERIARYQGRVWWCPLSDRVRAMLDFAAMWNMAQAKVGHDHYNVGELLAYVGRRVPVLSYLPQLYKPDSDSEVCSELLAELLAAGGLPGLQPVQTPPQRLAEMRLYAGCTQLAGPPAAIRNFNTV